MCARITLTLSDKIIKQILKNKYNVSKLPSDLLVPRYNISPGQDILSIINSNSNNHAGFLKWIFIPSYAKSENDGYKFINARSESIDSKITFKTSFLSKRCLVVADSFYEWKNENSKKIPYRFHRPNNDLFTLAAIWNVYTDKNTGNKTFGMSIITTEANNLVLPVHNRMPIVINPSDASLWLNPRSPIDVVKNLMKSSSDDYFSCYEVSNYVNSTKNQGAKCIKANL